MIIFSNFFYQNIEYILYNLCIHTKIQSASIAEYSIRTCITKKTVTFEKVHCHRQQRHGPLEVGSAMGNFTSQHRVCNLMCSAYKLKCSAYKVDVAHKPDVHLNIVKAEDHEISIETHFAVQYLNIEVLSINSSVKPFVIRLNSLDYSELREKIQAPIVNARNVIIHQSISDQFVKAFKEQVEQNERYHIDRASEVFQ